MDLSYLSTPFLRPTKCEHHFNFIIFISSHFRNSFFFQTRASTLSTAFFSFASPFIVPKHNECHVHFFLLQFYEGTRRSIWHELKVISYVENYMICNWGNAIVGQCHWKYPRKYLFCFFKFVGSMFFYSCFSEGPPLAFFTLNFLRNYFK